MMRKDYLYHLAKNYIVDIFSCDMKLKTKVPLTIFNYEVLTFFYIINIFHV